MTLEFTPAGFDAFQNNITDVSTVLIGTATSTGTASQPLQVTGGAYVSGNLGIGTTNPGAKLNVVDNSSTDALRITQTGSGNALVVEDSTNPDATPFVVNAVGSVGIGTTNPQTTLQVQGSSTALDTRMQSVAEKTSRINGNTASLVYNTGSGNIAICTNPTGNITLNVTNIPTDTTFDNSVLTFSVIISQTGTARSCTAVNLNGYPATIRWFGGSIDSALVGVTTTIGYDIYSFTGINTVGSASTTANYAVLGTVVGGYR